MPQNYVHKTALMLIYLKQKMHFIEGKNTQIEAFFVLFFLYPGRCTVVVQKESTKHAVFWWLHQF